MSWNYEKDYGYKYKQRTEEIDEVRYEVKIILGYDSAQSYSAIWKLVDFLVVIENDSNSNDNQKKEKVRADEPPYDIAVDTLDVQSIHRTIEPIPNSIFQISLQMNL